MVDRERERERERKRVEKTVRVIIPLIYLFIFFSNYARKLRDIKYPGDTNVIIDNPRGL